MEAVRLPPTSNMVPLCVGKNTHLYYAWVITGAWHGLLTQVLDGPRSVGRLLVYLL